jgi:hypothetical protein
VEDHGTAAEYRWNARRAMSFLRRHHFLAVLAFLTLLEVLTFGDIVSKIGFYLDDWNMVRELHFGPRQPLEMIRTYMLTDPKIIPRPVEALHFALSYMAFGVKPLGYHVLNGIMEIAVAFMAYVVVHRMCASKVLALLSASIFLLYPIHDSTHYWVVASSTTLSMLLFLASMYCHIEANSRSNPWLFAATYLLFALSIFNYECYLPLFPISIAAALYVTPRPDWLKRGLIQAIPYILSIAAVLAYGKLIVPMLAPGWVHSFSINPVAIIQTMIEGVQVSISPTPFTFFWSRVARDQALTQPMAWLAIAGAVSVGLVLLRAFAEEKVDGQRVLHMAGFGFAVVLFSYTIFGLNPEYEPTLLTIVNRINYGAAFGAGLLFASAAFLWRRKFLTTTFVALIAFCMLSNWALARPWMQAWMMQRHVRNVLTAHKTEFKSGDSIILLNSPRYVMWAPLFDGAWDFQNLAQLTLEDDTIRGGVVSERLVVEPSALKDISHEFLCGEYPYDRMHALVATKSMVIPVKNAEQFIDTVAEHGMGFDLNKTLPATWRRQAQLAAKPELAQ